MRLVFTMINYVINDWHCYYNYGYCYYCSPSVVLPILNCHFKSCWTQAECDLFQISFRSFNVRFKRGEKNQGLEVGHFLTLHLPELFMNSNGAMGFL